MQKLLSFFLLLTACGEAPLSPSPSFMDAGLSDVRVAADSGWTARDVGFDAPAPDSGADDVGPFVDAEPPPAGCGVEGWCWVMGAPLLDFHGLEESALFGVGVDGIVRVFDGEGWADHSSPTRARIRSVVARSASEVWILVGHEIWHFDGTEWQLQFVDEGIWRGQYYGHVDHLILDAEGQLFTARRRYSGNYYWSQRHEYIDGAWTEVDVMQRVYEERAADSYDEALRHGASAYEHAFDAAYFADVPTEVWVDGALAAWGTQPSDVVRVRAIDWREHMWERQIGNGFVPLDVDVVEPRGSSESQLRRVAVAGFPDGDALAVRDGGLFHISGTRVRASDPGQVYPRIKSLDDGRVARFFIEEEDGAAVGHVHLHTSETDVRHHVFETELCPANDWGFRGSPRFVDVAVDGDEIWASLMLDASRIGAPCLLHYDGATWAARSLGDEFLQQDGYRVTIGEGRALLYSQDVLGSGARRGPHILEVPSAFMRSAEPLESLVHTAVPQAADLASLPGARIWQGPTGLWLYENDQALFRAHETTR